MPLKPELGGFGQYNSPWRRVKGVADRHSRQAQSVRSVLAPRLLEDASIGVVQRYTISAPGGGNRSVIATDHVGAGEASALDRCISVFVVVMLTCALPVTVLRQSLHQRAD